jgi:TolB protein
MNRLALPLLASLLALVAWPAAAQVTVSKGRIKVALSGPPESLRVLANDFALSGVLEAAPAGKGEYTASITGGNGRLLAGGAERFTRPVGTDRASLHAFSDAIVQEITGKPGIASTRIAFISKRTGHKELHVMDLDGNGVKQISRDNNISGNPSFSTDGRRIAYTSYKSGYPDVYVVNLATGERTSVASFPGLNSGAAFSPDGSRLALSLSKDGNPEIYVMPSSGGAPSRLTRTPGTESSPSWAPNGTEIVYNSDDRGSPQLYILPASGGTPRKVPTGFQYATEPAWSPDGNLIAFNARVGGEFQVIVHNLRTGQSAQATTSGSCEDPTWCRDSRHLVYSRDGTLTLLDTVTGTSTALHTGLGECSEPSCTR